MRYLSSGESHGPCLTAIVEGLPAGLPLTSRQINQHLARRQQGYGRGGRMAIEKDQVQFLSGLRFNQTIGSPLTLQIVNRDWDNWQQIMAAEGVSGDQDQALTRPRPGHADLAGGLKYNYDDLRLVLERSSARETAIRVAVGSVGRALLEYFSIRIYSHVRQIGSVQAQVDSMAIPALVETVEKSPVRCVDHTAEQKMIQEIEAARQAGDTLGGVVEIIVCPVPTGLGSHVHWDRRLDGRLSGALASIQGIKGVEVGAGFSGAAQLGSELHDPIVRLEDGRIGRSANRAGGLEGGITNGQPLILRAAMKPIPTLARPLPSVDWHTGETSEGGIERSDCCAVPAAAIVAEAVVAWELALAFREKFGGDSLDEIEAAYHYYQQRVAARLEQQQQ